MKHQAIIDAKPIQLFKSNNIERLTLKIFGGLHNLSKESFDPFVIQSALMVANTNAPLFEPRDKILVTPYFTDDEKTLRICTGDSGGPSIMESNGEEYLVGLVSYGLFPIGYALKNMKFDVEWPSDCMLSQARITSISYHYDWIVKTIQDLRIKYNH